jgi:hypothetical protein
MFLVPLNQIESVELVIHALRVAGGEADCSTCPTRAVCMKQCLTIAGSIETMLAEGMLPSLDPTEMELDTGKMDAAEVAAPEVGTLVEQEDCAAQEKPKAPVSHLKIIK